MENIKFNQTHDDFGKKVLKIINNVYPYVKHRLYVAETKGFTPRNMYHPSGVIDDAIVDLYKIREENTLNDEKSIKLKLFLLSDQRIKKLLNKEKINKDSVNIRDILNNELKQLEEKFTVDADFDLIMEEELDDISYHQKDFKQKQFLYEDAHKQLIETLELSNKNTILSEKQRLALNNIYHWLPEETSNILDLFVFGKLTYEEITIIKQANEEDIRKNIQEVSRLIRRNIE